MAHTDIAGVFGRAVSRPLLEKTFHMKIQSRTVFLHRESFDTILDKTEQMLLKVSTFKYKNIKSQQVEPCDLTEFSTSLEYFGVVKFRPNYSSNHSASLAYHLDSCCSLKFRLQQLWRCSLYRLEFVLNLTPFLSLVCAKQPIKSGR